MSVVLTHDLCSFRPNGAPGGAPGGAKGARQGHLKVSLPVASLPRLAEALEGGGEVDADLHIGRSATGVPLVSGQVRARVARSCQRCLDTVEQTVEIELALGVAAPGTDPELPEGFEVCEAESLTLGELLEDEVLLALPMIALHDDRQQCGSLAGRVEQAEHENESEPSRHPFAVLKKLKSN